jgi:predicted Holliday junction resolvase-like endonuclease
MSGGKTAILLIVVFVIALFLGFLMGSKRVSDVQKELGMVKTDLENCQKEVGKAKTQKELARCRWALVETKVNAERRDFGKANEAFNNAKLAFSGAATESGYAPEFSEKLAPIQTGLGEIQTGLDGNDVKVAGRITEVINLIDVLLQQ